MSEQKTEVSPVLFKIGETYYRRSLSDPATIISYTIVHRSGSAIYFTETTDSEKRRMARVRRRNGIEGIRPEGVFKAAPELWANHLARDLERISSAQA